MGKLFVGTSGWSYKEWGKDFFPEKLPPNKHLAYLATKFNTVELNASFYRLQPASNFEKWYRETPEGFAFTVKVSRLITHIKSMNEVGDNWKKFFDNTAPLKEKRGAFLLQFPESFRGSTEDRQRIADFLGSVDPPSNGLRLAFEFRHADCFRREMLAVLSAAKVALVFANSSKYPTAPREARADFVYFRFHGPRELFASSYSEAELRPFAEEICRYLAGGKDAYAYFNNDAHTYAPENARMLRELVERLPPRIAREANH